MGVGPAAIPYGYKASYQWEGERKRVEIGALYEV